MEEGSLNLAGAIFAVHLDAGWNAFADVNFLAVVSQVVIEAVAATSDAVQAVAACPDAVEAVVGRPDAVKCGSLVVVKAVIAGSDAVESGCPAVAVVVARSPGDVQAAAVQRLESVETVVAGK